MPGRRDMRVGRPESRGCGPNSPGFLRAPVEVGCGSASSAGSRRGGGKPSIRRFWWIHAGGTCLRSNTHDIRALVRRNLARERARAAGPKPCKKFDLFSSDFESAGASTGQHELLQISTEKIEKYRIYKRTSVRRGALNVWARHLETKWLP